MGLDNLVAPIVSTLGDVLTLPSLWLATHLVTHGTPSTVLGWVLVGAATACGLFGACTSQARLRAIVRESWPVLVMAGLLSTLAAWSSSAGSTPSPPTRRC